MKRNMKWIALIVVVLAVGIGTAGSAISGLQNLAISHCRDSIKEKVLSRLDYTMQELKLKPEQQVQYSSFRERMGTDLDAIVKRHEALHDAIHAEMAKADPDMKSLAGKMRAEVEAFSGMLTAQIDTIVEVYDILDKVQQKQLARQLKEHIADHDDHR